jgi:hypothetical protein
MCSILEEDIASLRSRRPLMAAMRVPAVTSRDVTLTAASPRAVIVSRPCSNQRSAILGRIQPVR